jgi:hypothetical protein
MNTSTRTTAWKQQRMTMLERLVDHGLLTEDGSTRLLVEDCVEWGGSRNWQGYGKYGREPVPAHRAAYCVANGVSPDSIRGLFVLHSCDNPPCFNPAHLRLGTAAENTRDMMEKGRCNARSGERHGMAKLSDIQIEEIRALRGVVSQSELARRYDVRQPCISRIQTGVRRAVSL